MRIVLLGAPGSGKGTQSRMLAEHYGVPRISIGDVIRGYEEENPETALQAKMSSDTFHHLPEDLAFDALKERLSADDVKDGFLLVGFPRTTAQADRLDEILDSLNLPLDLVLQLDGDPDAFMERLEGRRICQSCGKMYNIFTNPPRVEGVCDECGGQIRRRSDDNEQTISTRMRIYEVQIATLSQYYKLHGKLRSVNAEMEEQPLFESLRHVIDATPPTVVVTEPIFEPPVSLEEHTMVSGSDDTNTTQEKDDKTAVTTEAAPTQTPVEAESQPEKAEVAAAPDKKPAKKKSAKKKAAKKKVAKKKVAKKKAPAKKAATKKAPVKKGVAKKKVAKKKAAKKTAKKAAVKKAAPKKKAVSKKKAVAKKAAKKKVAKKKAVTKKVAAKKSVTKKTVTKKTAKKAPAKKKAVKKSVAKKAPVKKIAKKAAVKKAAPKKKAASKKKAVVKKAAAKKAVKKAAVKKAVTKKSTAKKAAPKKAPAKKAPAKKTAKKATTKKTATKKASPKKKK